MASIRKRAWTTARGDSREAWQVDFVDQHGNRQQPQFARRADADAWLVAARAKVQAGVYTSDRASPTIGQACTAWLRRAAADGLELSTREQYRQHVDHILVAIDGDTKLSRLTQARCEEVRDTLLGAHSRDMARKVLQSFKALIREAKRRGLVAHNVAADTAIGTNGRHKPKLAAGVDFPTPGELMALVDHGDLKARAAICLAARVGLRASELRALPWAAVNPGSTPSVTVRQRADRWGGIGSPKSAWSRRTVPISEATAGALRAWKLAQPAGRTLVLGTGTDKPDMLGNLQRRLLTPLCRAAGVRRYSWHSLRHYAISSWLAACGGNFKLVQEWAGDSTLALILDRYGHLIPREGDRDVLVAAEQG